MSAVAAPTMTWLQTPGWLTPAEGEALQKYCRGKVVLELGSYKGRSTACIAEVAAHVISVDRHEGEEHDRLAAARRSQSHNSANTAPELDANLTACGVRDKVTTFRCTFEHWFGRERQYCPRPEVVFLDGDHDASAVERDTQLALTLGCPILFHDANYASVQAGALRAGVRLKHIAGSVALGEPVGVPA